jgi:hypothetical protein
VGVRVRCGGDVNQLTSPVDSINLGDTAECERIEKVGNRPMYTDLTWTTQPYFILYSHTGLFPQVLKRNGLKQKL